VDYEKVLKIGLRHDQVTISSALCPRYKTTGVVTFRSEAQLASSSLFVRFTGLFAASRGIAPTRFVGRHC
jgi:hypothetical protein